MVYFPAAVLGRDAKVTSMVLRKVLAISTEEPTTTGNDPNWRCIKGPYFWDSSCKERWGRGPMRLRFPIMGHGFGPGGKLSFFRRRIFEKSKRAKIVNHAAAKGVQLGASIMVAEAEVVVEEMVDLGDRNQLELGRNIYSERINS